MPAPIFASATGGRLGDKLVELGYVTRHALAQLLAEQTGVEFDLDSGFGTGLLAELRRRKDGTDSVEGLPQPVAVDDMWEPTIIHSAPPARPTEKAERMSTFNALEDMWARLTAAEARIEELQRELRTIPRS